MTDVTDNFNRANGGLGANWTSSPELATAGSGSLQISSNAVVSSPTSNFFVSWYNASAFNNDQNAQATIHGTSSQGAGVVVRHQPGHSSFYAFLANIINDEYYIRWDSGAFTILSHINTGPTAHDGSLIALRVSGSTLIASIDSVDQASVTDTTYTSGAPGVLCYTGIIDDWLGGPLGSVTGSVGTSAGVSTVLGVGASTSTGSGVAASAGISTVLGVSAATARSVASSSGVSTVLGVGPTIGVTDDFNRPHADLGVNWVESYFQIDVDTFPAGGAPGTVVGFAAGNAWYCGRLFSSDHFSQIVKVTGDGGTGGISVRNQLKTLGCYVLYDSPVLSNLVALFRQDGTALTILGSSISAGLGAGNTLKLSAAGSTLTYNLNGSDVTTRSDATYTGGAPGLAVFAGGARMDNWVGGSDAGPSGYVQDAFSYVPGTPLQSWWTATKGTWHVGTFTNVAASPDSGDGTIAWSGNLFPSDHNAQIILIGPKGQGATVRNSLVASNAYLASRDGTVGWGLYRISAGAYTALDSPTAPGTIADNATVLGISIVGTSITSWLDNTTRGPVTDATYSTGVPGAQASAGAPITAWLGWPAILPTVVSALGVAVGVSSVLGVGFGPRPATGVATANGHSTVLGVGAIAIPATIVGIYRALTDIYLPNSIYVEAGTTFTSPPDWIPAVTVDPIDTNAIQAYWNLGPVGMNDAEVSKAYFPNGTWSRKSGVTVEPPKVYWKRAPGGFILTGAGAPLGVRSF